MALPVARGYPQPLAAAYRVTLAEAAERLVKAGPAAARVPVRGVPGAALDDAALKRDPVLAALDPDLDSVLNVNEPADYEAARARPAPEVTVQLFGTLAKGEQRQRTARGPRRHRGRRRRGRWASCSTGT